MQEDDDDDGNKFWYITGAVAVSLAIALFLVRSNEHGKYESTSNAIKESKDFSAYKNSPLDKK